MGTIPRIIVAAMMRALQGKLQVTQRGFQSDFARQGMPERKQCLNDEQPFLPEPFPYKNGLLAGNRITTV